MYISVASIRTQNVSPTGLTISSLICTDDGTARAKCTVIATSDGFSDGNTWYITSVFSNPALAKISVSTRPGLMLCNTLHTNQHATH